MYANTTGAKVDKPEVTAYGSKGSVAVGFGVFEIILTDPADADALITAACEAKRKMTVRMSLPEPADHDHGAGGPAALTPADTRDRLLRLSRGALESMIHFAHGFCPVTIEAALDHIEAEQSAAAVPPGPPAEVLAKMTARGMSELTGEEPDDECGDPECGHPDHYAHADPEPPAFVTEISGVPVSDAFKMVAS